MFPSIRVFSNKSDLRCDPHKGFGIVNKAEVDVFLELFCFVNDPTDVGNLIPVWHWGNCEETPHVQGKRPSKTAGGAKSHLESNPMPTRGAQRLKQAVCTPGPGGPTETETDPCVSVSCGGAGQQWPAAGPGALGAADLGVA